MDAAAQQTTSTRAPRHLPRPNYGAELTDDNVWHLLSVRDVALACQLSEKAVRRAIDSGELAAVKLRSRLRVAPQDLEAWIASCRRTATPRVVMRPALGRGPAAGTFRALVGSEVER